MTHAPARLALALALAAGVPGARAFLGVADTSLVTVIANPAEAANWVSQLEKLEAQLEAANATLQVATQMRAYAGDPRAALLLVPDLSEISGDMAALASGGQTEADLFQAWQAEGSAQRLLGEAGLLLTSGAGQTMDVFGAQQPRNAGLYARLAADAQAVQTIRAQVSGEQAARRSASAELTQAWARFRAAATESEKQSALTEISQLQAQNQLMDARRRAELDDLALSDRQDRAGAGARTKAADEQALAESSELNAGEAARVQAAQAQRSSTLQKAAAAAPAADYSGLRLWTSEDAAGTSG